MFSTFCHALSIKEKPFDPFDLSTPTQLAQVSVRMPSTWSKYAFRIKLLFWNLARVNWRGGGEGPKEHLLWFIAELFWLTPNGRGLGKAGKNMPSYKFALLNCVGWVYEQEHSNAWAYTIALKKILISC